MLTCWGGFDEGIPAIFEKIFWQGGGMMTEILRLVDRCESRTGAGYQQRSALIRATLLMAAVLVLPVDSVRAEHSSQVVTLNFSGSGQVDTQEFDIPHDSAVYVKLKSYTPTSPTTNKPIIGFRNPNQFLCPARYDSFVEDATIGTSYGPFYMEAEAYQSYFALSPGADSYALEIAYRQQLIPNDAEPNDTSDIAQQLGNLPSIAHITGHLGYLGCVHDQKDYQRFKMTVSGDYLFDFQFDSPFRETTACKLYFHLYDETAANWVLSYTGPANGNDLGPKNLEAGHSYLMSMEASGCYEIKNEGGGTWVVNNKAGAYDVTLASQQTPPPGPPFSVNSVTIVPSTLFWGMDADVLAVLANNTGNPITNINVEISVERKSNNELIARKTYPLSLTPHQEKEINLKMSELLGGQNNINKLKEDNYSVTVSARQSALGHESADSGSFVFYRDIARIIGALRSVSSLLLKNDK